MRQNKERILELLSLLGVRLTKQIGEAHLTACRVRPKFIGGNRAVYDESLK